jgi:hypothetical protein
MSATTIPTTPRGRVLLALAAALAVTGALAVSAVAPDRSAAATKRNQGTLVLSQLRPFPGFKDRGIVHLTVKPRGPDSVVAALILPVVVAPSDPNGYTYALRLSRRTCRDIRRNPGSPGFVTGNLTTFRAPDGSAYLDDTDIVQVIKSELRAARSVVLLGRGDSSLPFQPQACSYVYHKVELTGGSVAS